MNRVANKGFEKEEIQRLRDKLKKANKSYLLVDVGHQGDDYVQFQFIGKYENQEVIYDAAIYTLRLHHGSEMYELAEEKAAEKFPNYHKIKELEEDEDHPVTKEEEEIGFFIAETLLDLEEEEAVKVQEHIEIDTDTDFGISIDVGLNVEEIDDEVIEKFITEFNADTFKPDPMLYSFQMDEDEEEEED